MLEGQEPTEELLREAAATVKDEVDPINDIRGSSGYKRDMAAVFAYRALRQALDRAEAAATA
jgi:carbon-monoxide dehydrogenase medium subunit